MAGLLKDATDYLKFLTTTTMTLEELNMVIKSVEQGTKEDNWKVEIVGNQKKIRKIRLNLEWYPTGENGNGNGNGGNGHGAI